MQMSNMIRAKTRGCGRRGDHFGIIRAGCARPPHSAKVSIVAEE